MRVILNNGTLVFAEYQKVFQTSVVNGVSLSWVSQPEVISLASYKFWCYTNVSDEAISIRIFDCKGNRYGKKMAVALFDDVPKVGDKFSEYYEAEALADFDKTITIPVGKTCAISDYAFADSGKSIPSIQINGETVALPN